MADTGKLSNYELGEKMVRLSRFPLEVMQSYVLPLLYGLLGALAFVLRSLVKEIKNLTFTPESRIGYGLRIFLGMVMGLMVRWFFGGGEASGSLTMLDSLKELSPLAVSFIAGYGVELVFSAMDGIVASLARKKA
jgi:hypothetical protein